MFLKNIRPWSPTSWSDWFPSQGLGAYLYLNLVKLTPGRIVGWNGYSHSIFTFYGFSSVHPQSFLMEKRSLGLLGWICCFWSWLATVHKIVIPPVLWCGAQLRPAKPLKSAWKIAHVESEEDSFRRLSHSYHRRLLSDGTLMVQVLLMMMLPYIFPPQWSSRDIQKNTRGLGPCQHPSIWYHWPLLPSWSVFSIVLEAWPVSVFR